MSNQSLFSPPPTFTREADSIAELAAEVKSIVAEGRKADKLDLERTVRLGVVLAKIKEKIKAKGGHGKWLPQLNEMGVDRRRASEAIWLSKCPPADISNCKSKKEALLRHKNPEKQEQEIARPASNRSASSSTTLSRKYCHDCRKKGMTEDCPACKELNEAGQTEQSPDGELGREEESDTEEGDPEKEGEEEANAEPQVNPVLADRQKFDEAVKLLKRATGIVEELEASRSCEISLKGTKNGLRSKMLRGIVEHVAEHKPLRVCPKCEGGSSSDAHFCDVCQEGYIFAGDVKREKEWLAGAKK